MKKAYIYIILGALVASTRFFFEKYDQILLVFGLMLLMAGIYSISKSLPSKKESDFQQPLVPPQEQDENNDEKIKS